MDSTTNGPRPLPSQIVRPPASASNPVPGVHHGRRSDPAAVGGTADRPGPPSTLDEVDRQILKLLAADARTPNNALAAAVGIAPSTCLGRVRALRAGGAIRGFHADIDPTALGRPLQAMIAVRLQAGARSRMKAFTDRIRSLPEVLDLYFLAGADDFLLHVAAADAIGLRDFVVDQLSAHPEVALTETNLIFEHLRGSGPA
ncbi:DNA-binding Lrp family transcriptional regulator [Nakamurella sp. UYEF19]|uniref:Lrp/AsnC family transcriptional regulator n=1 Tax=Nakamurella sp. UYEF19 TaxID=1756392 RepID=UPI00339B13B5